MPSHSFPRSLRRYFVSAALLLTLPAAASGQEGCASGCGVPAGCAPACHSRPCPPPYRHIQEGPPRIRIKCGCPHPVCPPCELQHWGYFQTCWRPWPWPPNWSHCPQPNPAALVGHPLAYRATTPGLTPPVNGSETVPMPRPGGPGL
jgi:hypothetical protein